MTKSTASIIPAIAIMAPIITSAPATLKRDMARHPLFRADVAYYDGGRAEVTKPEFHFQPLPGRFDNVQIRSGQEKQYGNDARRGHDEPQKLRRLPHDRSLHKRTHDQENDELCGSETDKS